MNIIIKRIIIAVLMTAMVCTASAKSVTVMPTDDNFVYSGSKDEVMAGGIGLTLAAKRSTTSTGRRKFYVRFSLTSAEVGGAVDADSSATVTVKFRNMSTYYSGNATFGFYALTNTYVAVSPELGTDWSETNITFNNAPANQSGGYDTEFNEVASFYVTNSVIQAADNYPFVITIPKLGDYLQTDNSVTIAMQVKGQSNTSPLYYFNSRESGDSTAPTIEVEVNPMGTIINIR